MIVIISNSSDSSKGLPAVSRLNSYMDIILSASGKQILISLASIRKGAKRVEVLDNRHTTQFLFLRGNSLRKAVAGEGEEGTGTKCGEARRAQGGGC